MPVLYSVTEIFQSRFYRPGFFSAKDFCRFFNGGLGGFGGLAELAVCNYLIVSWLHSNRQTANSAKGIFKTHQTPPEGALDVILETTFLVRARVGVAPPFLGVKPHHTRDNTSPSVIKDGRIQ